eukprot:s1894_g15.t1
MSRKELNATTWKPCQNCNQLWPTVSLKQLPATREKALIAEMSLAQAHSVNEDNRLPEELAELQQKSVSDALDLQLEESKQAPLFSMPNVLPQGTTTAGPAEAKASGIAAPPAADPGAPTSEVLNTGLLETQMAILSRLRDLKHDSKGDSGKPKVKEAETINLPEFPNPESYRSWKTATREAVRAASDSPDEAFKRILEAYDKDANHESLRDPGKFLTLDTKLLAVLTKVARGELSREILIFKETEASKSRAVRGRQVLYLFDQYFKTNEEIPPKLAAAASHDEDFWEVDFTGNRLIRHHKKYRVDWYVPDNSCPVNPKKLRSQAKLEQVLRVAPYVGSKSFDWRKVSSEGPGGMWVGKTLFYFQALPKIAFDNTVEMIAIEPDGKQRKHAYLPRAFNNTFPAAEDCPRADPKDLKRSILWAKQFSNTIECSLQDMNAKCEFECDEEGFVCEHCERLIRPACAGLVPGLEFLADTGSEEDLISKSDCRAHFPDVPIGPFTRPVSLTTANGPVKGDQSVKLEVPEISSILECYVLEGISQRPSEPQQQGCALYLVGPNTYCPLNAFSKKQTSITMSSTESEVISANHGVRAQGIPSLSLWMFLWRQVEVDPANHQVRPKRAPPVKIDGVLDRVDPELDEIRYGGNPGGRSVANLQGLHVGLSDKFRVQFLEDNQATITIVNKGDSENMRHTDRTQNISFGWLKQQFEAEHFDMANVDTLEQVADIFTKPFAEKTKWLHALRLINHNLCTDVAQKGGKDSDSHLVAKPTIAAASHGRPSLERIAQDLLMVK